MFPAPLYEGADALDLVRQVDQANLHQRLLRAGAGVAGWARTYGLPSTMLRGPTR
ncbi:hypothetical protein ACIBKY_33275 [Nonomuraea sp. NPDC050394]|uniref:hypothetical protein n=1 Tax=Nonomuraea sp. NPDC050394 TaxID=3364363 RepID=UPI00379367D3